jgi:hypothetical protein
MEAGHTRGCATRGACRSSMLTMSEGRVAKEAGEVGQEARLAKQIPELGPPVDDLAHEPALRHDLEIEATHFLKGAAHQMVAMAAAAKAQGNLGVIDGHNIARDAIIRELMRTASPLSRATTSSGSECGA